MDESPATWEDLIIALNCGDRDLFVDMLTDRRTGTMLDATTLEILAELAKFFGKIGCRSKVLENSRKKKAII